MEKNINFDREFKMKIAFTTKGIDWDAMIDPRFGRTGYLLIYDEEKDDLSHINNSSVENEAHGAGPITAQKLAKHEAAVLITGNGPGGNAGRVLETMGVKIFIGAGDMTVKQAYQAYRDNQLNIFEPK